MVAAVPLQFEHAPPPRSDARRGDPDFGYRAEDQRVVIYDVSWDAYVTISDTLGDRAGVRVCFCEGTLELMSPGFLHEDKKKCIARLLELYALARDVALHGLGSMTFRNKRSARAAEPDECYFLGKATEGEPPQIAIEVASSRSAIDKQSLYAGLLVSELWLWERGRIAVYHLGKVGYREVKRSRALPELDLEELTTFVAMPDQAAAVKAYWKALQKSTNRPSKARPARARKAR